jgi:hypothetical protein
MNIEEAMKRERDAIEHIFRCLDESDYRLSNIYNELPDPTPTPDSLAAEIEDFSDAVAQARLEVLQRLWTWNPKYKEVV